MTCRWCCALAIRKLLQATLVELLDLALAPIERGAVEDLALVTKLVHRLAQVSEDRRQRMDA
jgi:hypothetical protein